MKKNFFNSLSAYDSKATVKNFIFADKHDLRREKDEYFAPNYEMAQSWQRLIDGKAEPTEEKLIMWY